MYPMSLGHAQSNPATPDAYDVPCSSTSVPMDSAGVSADYFHPKRPSSGSSMGHSPTSFSGDLAMFGNTGASQAPQSHGPAPRSDPSNLSGHRHYPTSYSSSGTPEISVHGQPHVGQASVPNQREASMFQQHQTAPAAAPIRLSNPSVFRTENPNQMQREVYNLAFNGMVPPPPPSPTYPVDWNMIHHNNNPTYVQGGIPARLVPPYVPNELLNPEGLEAAMARLSAEQLQQLCTHLPYHTLVQQHLEHRYHAEARATLNNNTGVAAAAYDMNRTGGGIPYSHPNSSGGTPRSTPTPTEYGRAAAAVTGPRPLSQSTMSTPSLSAPSPTSTWSPPPEQHPTLIAGPSSVYGSYPGTTTTTTTAPLLRDPPTPPTLPDGAMPCNPSNKRSQKKTRPSTTSASKCHHHLQGNNRSISSVPSERSMTSSSTTTSSVPITPSSLAPTSIPLRVRVSALSKDKRTLFERAAGDLWDPRSSTEDHEQGLDRAQVQLLEDLYALIGSDELRLQYEIPDELVEPVLKTKLLPRADAHKGSRGGAAGHVCLWHGCGKEIKRLDHSRNHIREHVKSKPHTCGSGGSDLKGCGQTFLRMDDLKRHQKSHCSVLRSGPGRRPRSIRGTRRRETDEEEEEHSEDSVSLDGGDDDDYRPVHMRSPSSTSSATRELASRLRRQRTSRFAAVVVDESTSESDSNEQHNYGRHQTSNVRRAVESPVQRQHQRHHSCGDEVGVNGGTWMDNEKVWLAYGTLMAGCSLQFITVPIVIVFCLLSFLHLSAPPPPPPPPLPLSRGGGGGGGAVVEMGIGGGCRCGVQIGWRRPCGETLRMMLTT